LGAATTELNAQSGGDSSSSNDWQEPRSYYVGPYCSDRDGASIYVGVFSDLCVTPADVSAYRSAHYGADLPFSSIPMVQGRTCISCQDDDDADADGTTNGDNDDDDDAYTSPTYGVLDVCLDPYVDAAKCEAGSMAVPYPDTSACDYIRNVYPILEAASRSRNGNWAFVAWSLVGVLAAAVVLLGAYAWVLRRRTMRQRGRVINLSAQEGGAIA
jgi:hypothetical protein